MSITGVSFLLIIFLGVTRHSVGAPLGKEARLGRIKEYFRRMAYLCDHAQPKLKDLAYETKRAFAQEYFGDPREARGAIISGFELLDSRTRLPLHVFASKAYKQVAILHSVFQNITQHWLPSQGENKKIKNIKDNLSSIQERLNHLKKLMEKVVRLSSQSPGSSSLPQVPLPNRMIWSKSTYRQRAWILGVLGKFELSLLYLRPAIRTRACKACTVN